MIYSYIYEREIVLEFHMITNLLLTYYDVWCDGAIQNTWERTFYGFFPLSVKVVISEGRSWIYYEFREQLGIGLSTGVVRHLHRHQRLSPVTGTIYFSRAERPIPQTFEHELHQTFCLNNRQRAQVNRSLKYSDPPWSDTGQANDRYFDWWIYHAINYRGPKTCLSKSYQTRTNSDDLMNGVAFRLQVWGWDSQGWENLIN